MNVWLLAGIAFVLNIAWMAWMIYSAPIGVEDEQGFRVLEPGRHLQDVIAPSHAREHEMTTEPVSKLPLWPG